MFKKSFMLLLFICSVALLTGCDLLNSDLRLFKQTYDNMEKANNYSMRLSATQDGEEEYYIVEVDFDDDQNGKFKVENADLLEYYEVTDNTTVRYFKYDNDTTWRKKNIDPNSEYEFPYVLLDFMDYSFLISENLDYELVEKQDDYHIYKISLQLDTILAVKQALEETKEIPENEYNQYLAKVDFKVTIDLNNKVVKKIEADLSDLFKSLSDLYGQRYSNSEQLILTISYSQFNEVEVYITNEMKNGIEENGVYYD